MTLTEWKKDFKEFLNMLMLPRDDYKGILSYIDEVPANDGEWIPCSERLPDEEEKCYWVCTDTGYQCQCRWTNNVYGIRDGDEWRWKIFDIPQYSHVIAWMHLPEAYRGDGDENV